MKTLKVEGKSVKLTPIVLEGPLGGFADTEYYLGDDDSIIFTKKGKVTHRFPKDSPNRKVAQFRPVE